MLGLVARLVIHMYIRPFHVWQALQLELKRLRHVMCGLEGHILVHHHVDLSNEPWSRVIHPNRINLLYVRAVCDGYIRDELLYLRVGRHTNQQQELLRRGSQPNDIDECGEDDSPHRINPPSELRAAYGGENTEAVDKQIVAVVLLQDIDLAVLILECPAIQP